MTVFRAKYASWCRRCGRKIVVGHLAAKAYDINAFVHKDCMYPRQPVDRSLEAGLAGGFTVGVTGSTYLGKRPVPALRTWLDGLDADAFATIGWGTGIDREAGRYLASKRRTTAQHFVVVPDQDEQDWWSVRQGQVHLLPGGTLAEANACLVMLVDHLVAIVKGPRLAAHPEDTAAWDAVHKAQELGVGVTLMELGGYKQWNHTTHPAYRYRRLQEAAPVEVVEAAEDKEYF
jgi:hypothetical protein